MQNQINFTANILLMTDSFKVLSNKYLVLGSTLLVFIVNGLAGSTKYIGGVDTKYISDMHPTNFTPAPYVFSIWGVIYLGLVGFLVYLFMKKDVEKDQLLTKAILPLFAISNILNIVWIFLWQYDYVNLALPVLILFLISMLAVVKKNFGIQPSFNSAAYWFRRIPFEIYGAWLSVATIGNIAISLKSVLLKSQPAIQCIKAPCESSVSLLGQSEITWTYIMIAIAILIGLYMTWRYKAWPFIAVIAWAVVGIFMK
jgi:benzodiazapine receptor